MHINFGLVWFEKERTAIHSTPLDRIKSGTPHILNHLICDQHEILLNFHVLTISVAAMDQQFFLFLVSEIQPHACLFTSSLCLAFGISFS